LALDRPIFNRRNSSTPSTAPIGAWFPRILCHLGLIPPQIAADGGQPVDFGREQLLHSKSAFGIALFVARRAIAVNLSDAGVAQW
jgi:hypothetical protein